MTYEQEEELITLRDNCSEKFRELIQSTTKDWVRTYCFLIATNNDLKYLI